MIDLDLDISYEGRTAHVIFRLPMWRHAAWGRDPASMDPDRVADAIKSAVVFSVDRIDGKRLTTPRRDALLADSIAVAAILYRRYQLHESLRAMGRVFAQCPHCKAGEVEMSLLGYFTTLGVLVPMISDDFIHFMPPALSIGGPEEPRRWRDLTFASRLRFALPSTFAGLPTTGFSSGVMNPISSERMVEAREQWDVQGVIADPPAWWTEGDACYDATLAMFIGVTGTDVPMTTPEMIANMPAYDVYFLDAAFWLTHFAQIPEGALERPCPACSRTFLPLAARGIV